jgi:ABC-type iron transport system FetAB ATPase subunit
MKKIAHWRLILGVAIASAIYLVFYPGLSQSSIITNLISFFTISDNRIWIETITIVLLVGTLIKVGIQIKKRPNIKFDPLNDLLIQCIVVTVYFCHRFTIVPGQQWEFESFLLAPSLYYMDIVIISLLLLSYNPRLKFPKQEKIEDRLIEDNYHKKTNLDIFDRKDYAASIAELIKVQKVSHAFGIAITGQWGSGKTVFLNQIAENISQQEGIVIQFNPWLTKDPSLLTENFFSLVNDHVKVYSGQISRNVRLYSQALLNLEDNFKVKVSKFLKIQSDITLEKLRSNIKEGLSENELKLVILIDDLDRLNSEEVLAVMTLIRNSFNFPNVFFLVAYDHDYIVGLLEDKKVKNPSGYLEKIFSMEIELPSFPLNILKPCLLDLLGQNKNELQKAEIKASIEQIDEAIGFNMIARNLRECVRLANSFNHVYDLKHAQVDLTDCLLLEIIKVKRREIYNLIKNDITYNRKLSFLKYPETELEENISFIHSMQGSSHKEVHADDETLLDYLFNRNTFDSVKSIRIFDNYLRYFSSSLFGTISFDDFYSYKETSLERFVNYVTKHITDGHEKAIQELLLRSNSFNSKNDFTNFIIGYIQFANITHSENLVTPVSSLIAAHRKLFATKEELEGFIDTVLEFSSHPRIEASVGNNLLLANSSTQYPEERFDPEIILKHLRRYLKDALTLPEVNIDRWYYLYRNTVDDKLNNDPASLQMVQEYINNNKNDYLKSIEIQEQAGRYYLDVFIGTYLGWQNFENILYEGIEDLHVLELKCFLKMFKLHSYKPFEKQKNEFYIVSDEDTYFERSTTYPDLPSGKSEMQAFLTNLHDTEQYIPLRYAFWIAHNEEITQQEEIGGGGYIFSRTFNVHSETKVIKEATLYFMVDDEMTIQCNGEILETRYVQNEQGKKPFEINLFEFLNAESNTIRFHVFNKTVDDPELILNKGQSNPYGFIYGLYLKYGDK